LSQLSHGLRFGKGPKLQNRLLQGPFSWRKPPLLLRARIAKQRTERLLFPNLRALRLPLSLYRFSTFPIRFRTVLGKLSQRLSSRKESSSTGRGRASPPRAWDGGNLSSFLHPPRVGEGFPHHGWWGRFSPLLLHERKPPSDQRASREVMPLPLSIHGAILNPLLFQQFSLRSSDILVLSVVRDFRILKR